MKQLATVTAWLKSRHTRRGCVFTQTGPGMADVTCSAGTTYVVWYLISESRWHILEVLPVESGPIVFIETVEVTPSDVLLLSSHGLTKSRDLKN